MRTFLTVILAAICLTGYSQKKPKISTALSEMEKGNLSEAKTIIDAAIEHEKTMNVAKTWYYRGQIYAALDTAANEEGALEESLKSFDKALELDPEQKSINAFTATGLENIDSKKQGYYAYYYNEAINAYNAETFDEATIHFETAFFINPSDTNAILNAAYSASASGNDEKAKANYEKSLEAGVKELTVYLQLYNYAVKEERLEDGLDIIRKAKAIYPSNIDVAKYEINLLMQLEKTDEARDGLVEAIKAEPENADLLFSLGVLEEELGNEEAAMNAYKQALEANPDHYNSNFNVGVFMFNEANELIKEKNALSYKEVSKNKELTTKIDDKLTVALPTWEKLYSLNGTDQTVLETLGYIYNSLKMTDKYNKIQDELDAISN